ncbi:Methyltransferase domain-containing protein [Halogranum amylolyticum]|uniref:Methyltransferase domain-containing protein n=1 Tax=Halogranum amylolyticum TaxID=660520 RepID=A0A1H8TK72_9EURY|nr:class I SAM-dependent methyltransferase [Halogranum amylolyticum]SEO90888.1 Methyltransferase domain-containing protein [Halogranum amylolyticum]
MFNFGVYHWRRRLRRLLVATVAVAFGGVAWRLGHDRRFGRLVALLSLVWGVVTGGRTLRSLLSPPPWHVDRTKYEALAAVLPLGDAGTVVDVGCGTGRSLVGLAPAITPDTTVVALDVYDDRIILGNGPALARRNAATAGLSVVPVRGDAVALPFRDGSVDVLTACRVLHDLPRSGAQAALRDAHRVLAPNGRLGVLELPIPHDEDADPAPYWRELLVDAGFTVTEQRTFETDYHVLAATPDQSR